MPPPPACPWDLDKSETVDTSDLLALFAQWGTAGPADFNGNGVVNTADLLILFANWGLCGLQTGNRHQALGISEDGNKALRHLGIKASWH